MSVGNQTQAVDFDKNHLTLVLGENVDLGGDDSGSRNGTGKTTIVNALSYALYGQALTNIRKENLINKTNGKAMLVTVEFEVNGIAYRIERGRKPNVLKFFVNDEEQKADNADDDAQGDSRETQKAIEHLLGMSHMMFKHLVALALWQVPHITHTPYLTCIRRSLHLQTSLELSIALIHIYIHEEVFLYLLDQDS